jgi:WD40 repeat protein
MKEKEASIASQKKILPKFNPFPGLRPFSISESHLFFGREGQSDEIMKNLAEHRFVAVMGASGSGKSSLIYCGLVPILYGGFITEAGSFWRVIHSRPGSAPIENLADAIAKSDVPETASTEERAVQKNITSTILRSSSLGLIEAIGQLKKEKDENVLVIIDQFEELFRYKNSLEDEAKSINESNAFVKLLLAAIKQSEVPIYVVLTMRSDFIGDCAQFHELTRSINDSNYLIPRMTRDDFKNAVEGPVAVGGGQITSRLVQQLLNDVGDNQDQLPILQHALMRTWDYWVKNRVDEYEEMDIEHYEAIGKLDSALSEHANEAYDELSENGKRICESIFKTLTEKGGDNRGIRHPTQIVKIAEIAQAAPEEVFEVVETFREQGRSFLMPASNVPLKAETVIDISHESLMRIWDRLKVWVDDEANAVNMYLRLAEAAEMYQEGKTGLWRPPDLQLALNWREKQKPTLTWAKRFNPAFERTMVYLDTSEREFKLEEENKIKLQKRQLRRTRIFAVILGSAAIVSIGVMLYAFVLSIKADQERDRAVKLQAEAESQKLRAESEKDRAEQQRELADIERAKATEQERLANEAALKAEEERQRAVAALSETEKQKLLVEKQKRNAEEATVRAEQNAARALEQEKLAMAESEKAYGLRMLSTAKSMAVKSTKIKRDLNLKTLISYQAYQFNEEYGGRENDPDVYSGLYFTEKATNEDEFNSLRGHQGAVRSLAYNSKGDKLYTAGSDGRVIVWDMSNNEGNHTTLQHNRNSINRSMAISSNDKWLAVGTGNLVQLIELTSTRSPVLMKGHNNDVWATTFTSDNKYLISAGADSSIYKWDIGTQTPTLIAKTASHIKSIAVSPDNSYIIGGTESGQLIKFMMNGEAPEEIIDEDPQNPIYAVAISHDGGVIASGDLSGTVHLYDARSSEKSKFQSLSGHDARINDLKFSPNDERLASASYDGRIQLWDTKNFNDQPIVLEDHTSWVWAMAFSPDNKYLISGCVDRLIRKYPTHAYEMAQAMCGKVSRNISKKEWDAYVGEDIPYRKTCAELPPGEGVIILNE